MLRLLFPYRDMGFQRVFHLSQVPEARHAKAQHDMSQYAEAKHVAEPNFEIVRADRFITSYRTTGCVSAFTGTTKISSTSSRQNLSQSFTSCCRCIQ